MTVALCIFRYFPYGGLQKDFLRVAEECVQRGHHVEAFCAHDSDIPEYEQNSKIHWRILKISGWTNHARASSFEKKFLRIARQEKFDCVLGFNRMAELDFYFAGDGCFAEGVKTGEGGVLKQWLPRYRRYLQMERSVASPCSRTKILTLVDKQREDFQRWYKTPSERFDILPIGFDPRCGNIVNSKEVRTRVRKVLGLDAGEKPDLALALVGSDFKRKGADRAIAAIAALPEDLRSRVKFFLVGKSDPEKYIAQAATFGIADSIVMLGGRDDVPELMCAMDLLVHPAREEAGGSVLLEAAVSGLPVICTDICGFSPQIEQWDCGETIPSPFEQSVFNAKLEKFVRELLENKHPRTTIPANPVQWRRAGVIVDILEKHVSRIRGK